MRNFAQTRICVDTKIMLNFVQKSHFVPKRETFVQENLLFRGNPKNGVDSIKGPRTVC